MFHVGSEIARPKTTIKNGLGFYWLDIVRSFMVGTNCSRRQCYPTWRGKDYMMIFGLFMKRALECDMVFQDSDFHNNKVQESQADVTKM